MTYPCFFGFEFLDQLYYWIQRFTFQLYLHYSQYLKLSIDAIVFYYIKNNDGSNQCKRSLL